jgi:ABC-2 type transport system permease protein
MTSPVRDLEIVLGKWLAAMVLYASILGISAINIAILYGFGRPDLKPILVGYLGLLLQGGACWRLEFSSRPSRAIQIIAGAPPLPCA